MEKNKEKMKDTVGASKSPIKRLRGPSMSPSPRKRYALPRKSIFGANRDEDSVSWVKQVALDPLNLESLDEELEGSCEQITNVNYVMCLANTLSPNKRRVLGTFANRKLGVTDFKEENDLQTSPIIDIDESDSGLKTPTRSTYSGRLRSIMHHITREKTVPVGPGYQVEVPVWTEPVNRVEYSNDDFEPMKWVATRVWPKNGESTEAPLNEIGKGRPEDCKCSFPGSAECIRQHMQEKKKKLLSEIGAMFWIWNFNKMGEAVSYSWTMEEQKIFSDLKLKYLKDDKMFWKMAEECFPTKTKKSLLSYFFNVLMPRILRDQADNSVALIYSDGEEIEDNEDTTTESAGFLIHSSSRTLIR